MPGWRGGSPALDSLPELEAQDGLLSGLVYVDLVHRQVERGPFKAAAGEFDKGAVVQAEI